MKSGVLGTNTAVVIATKRNEYDTVGRSVVTINVASNLPTVVTDYDMLVAEWL